MENLFKCCTEDENVEKDYEQEIKIKSNTRFQKNNLPHRKYSSQSQDDRQRQKMGQVNKEEEDMLRQNMQNILDSLMKNVRQENKGQDKVNELYTLHTLHRSVREDQSEDTIYEERYAWYQQEHQIKLSVQEENNPQLHNNQSQKQHKVILLIETSKQKPVSDKATKKQCEIEKISYFDGYFKKNTLIKMEGKQININRNYIEDRSSHQNKEQQFQHCLMYFSGFYHEPESMEIHGAYKNGYLLEVSKDIKQYQGDFDTNSNKTGKCDSLRFEMKDSNKICDYQGRIKEGLRQGASGKLVEFEDQTKYQQYRVTSKNIEVKNKIRQIFKNSYEESVLDYKFERDITSILLLILKQPKMKLIVYQDEKDIEQSDKIMNKNIKIDRLILGDFRNGVRDGLIESYLPWKKLKFIGMFKDDKRCGYGEEYQKGMAIKKAYYEDDEVERCEQSKEHSQVTLMKGIKINTSNQWERITVKQEQANS